MPRRAHGSARRGHDSPLFFYDQKDGLAVVEALAAAVGFAIFGPGAVTLKAAILAVWIAGATTALVYVAQPLWLPGLVPIVVYHLARTRSGRTWAAYLAAVALPIAVFTVAGYLQSRGVTRVYSENALLQWTIDSYSGETILARWKGARDRYPPYIAAVDRAPKPAAPSPSSATRATPTDSRSSVPDTRDIADIDRKYFVYLAPDRDLLIRAGFQLTR
jgi:hypothetical protein